MRRFNASWVVVALLVLARAASGAEESESRMLGDHTFLYPRLQTMALPTTHFGVQSGVGVLNINELPLGDLGLRDVNQVGGEQSFDFGLRFGDRWGLDLAGAGRVVLGSNGGSLVVRTGLARVSGEVSPVFALLRRPDSGTLLSARLFGSMERGDRINLIPLLEDLQNDPLLSVRGILDGDLGRSISSKVSNTGAGAGLFLAQAIGPVVGFQASLTGRYYWESETTYSLASGVDEESKNNLWTGTGAIQATVDFASLHVPIALSGEYAANYRNPSSTSIFIEDEGFEHTVSAAVYYTGAHNLELGIRGSSLLSAPGVIGRDESGAVASSNSPQFYTAHFMMTYVW